MKHPAPQRRIPKHGIEVLRRAWDEGKASGTASTLDIRRILVEEQKQYQTLSRARRPKWPS